MAIHLNWQNALDYLSVHFVVNLMKMNKNGGVINRGIVGIAVKNGVAITTKTSNPINIYYHPN